ncbi:haloacid dehalogenase, type II [Kwoniella shandongensis]|uniref:Haloacid dehalogenase, type II n=1 Tax=Kwoniella shandongensis TaxID=1734106 RepID=A0A5M6C0Q4_9TREE|nr:haloacid dehalogenase, type II [Kwoniella shandongensis]KAA5528140.1 haloacid dehalogenase, type II [Kwoniella shandongensis]
MEQYKALVFDCYGTLIDWEKGMYESLQSIFEQKTCPDAGKVFTTLSAIENRIQAEDKTMVYPAVLKLAYKSLAGELRLWADDDAAQAFGESVGKWPAFPDSADALGKLKGLGLKLIILSNVDNGSFAETRKKLEKGWGSFDGIYTAEDIGSYKPDLRNFKYALESLDRDFDISPNEVLCVANSRLHDVEPAHKMGLKAAWINRSGAIMGVKGREDSSKPDWTFNTMAEFADAIERDKRGD